MNLTKQDVLRINAWTENNVRAREDYHRAPLRHCSVWWCDRLRRGRGPHCEAHRKAWARFKARVLGVPRAW